MLELDLLQSLFSRYRSSYLLCSHAHCRQVLSSSAYQAEVASAICGTDLRRHLLLSADHGAWSKQTGWGKSRMEAGQRCLCALHEYSILCTYQKMSMASCAGDEAAHRLSQSGYDITPLTAQKKSELAAMLTDHQR